MANYIISYDLNGYLPSHAMVDRHIRSLGIECARTLESEWYVRSSLSLAEIGTRMESILSPNDRLAIIEAKDMWVRNLLVETAPLQRAWLKP